MNTETKITTRPSFSVVGFKVRTQNKDEMNPATGKIGPLWGKVMSGNVFSVIKNQTSSHIIYSLYTEYEGDHTGEYSYILGRQINEEGDVPEGMTSLTIPEQKYMVFTAQGSMPQAVVEMWQYIWQYFEENDQHQRTYTVDFEVHDSKAADKVEIYIAIK